MLMLEYIQRFHVVIGLHPHELEHKCTLLYAFSTVFLGFSVQHGWQ